METIRTLLKWAGIPIMALSGIIYALLKQNQGLKQDLRSEKAERAVDQIKREISEAERDANEKQADYESTRDAYTGERGEG
jgi:uncharacterized membrane protein YukC